MPWCWMLWGSIWNAQAAPFSTAPVEGLQEQAREQLSERERQTQARLEAFEREQGKTRARVIVVQWQGSELDFSNELLQRNIKARLTRSGAVFVPDVDVYQHGRAEPDPTIRPLDQRALVPSSTIPTVNAAVDAAAQINWAALDEQEWGRKAAELRVLSEQIWFVDREELREPLFRLYAQIGRAAENGNIQAPPYFEEVGGVPVNYYYYLAASMAAATPDLMSKLHDSDLIGAIGNTRSRIEQGAFRKLSLNFELNGRFEPRAFIRDYQVWIDGVAVEINNERALYEVPAGRADVYLRRTDGGYGQSVRVEEVRVDAQEIYSVREQARKRMGIDFYRELMKNKNQCLPEVSDDVLTYVAIYQQLHPGEEVYIAVPEGGSVNRIHLWKWIGERGQLVKQYDGASSFPVRFAALVGGGFQVSGASFEDPYDPDNYDEPPTEVQSVADPASLVQLKPNAAPLNYELRAHWDRLMVAVGMDLTANLQQDGWVEIPHSRTGTHRVEILTDAEGDPYHAPVASSDRVLLKESDFDKQKVVHPATMGALDEGGYDARRFSRNLYVSVGGVLLREAAAGFGPRVAVRAGLVNAPHAVDLTLRAGWAVAVKPQKKRRADRRMQVLVDTEVFGGMLLPYGDTLYLLSNREVKEVDGELELTPVNDGAGDVWGRRKAGSGGAIAVGDDRLQKIGAPLPSFGVLVRAGTTF